MAQITGKTVYILGAGASAHTGAPVLRDFLVRSRLLSEGRTPPYFRPSFENVFTWINELRSSSYYVEFDLDNLEHIFSLADMSRQLELPGGEQRFNELLDIIAETLDSCESQLGREGCFLPDDTYTNFAKILDGLNKRRADLIGQHSDHLQRDVIITFNYDVMLDFAMHQASVPYNYGLENGPAPGIFSLLKLHGSLNWTQCPSCNGLRSLNPILPPRGARRSSNDRAPFRMAIEGVQKAKCQKAENCKRTDPLKPLLIPPTWSKAIGKTSLARVWSAAVCEIQTAFQSVVIGYSMPLTDTFFQYLLTLGLQTNPTLNRVVVVNSDESDEFKSRYKRVFSRSLDDRGRLQFIPLRFKQFVGKPGVRVGAVKEEETMETIGGKI